MELIRNIILHVMEELGKYIDYSLPQVSDLYKNFEHVEKGQRSNHLNYNNVIFVSLNICYHIRVKTTHLNCLVYQNYQKKNQAISSSVKLLVSN